MATNPFKRMNLKTLTYMFRGTHLKVRRRWRLCCGVSAELRNECWQRDDVTAKLELLFSFGLFSFYHALLPPPSFLRKYIIYVGPTSREPPTCHNSAWSHATFTCQNSEEQNTERGDKIIYFYKFSIKCLNFF